MRKIIIFFVLAMLLSTVVSCQKSHTDTVDLGVDTVAKSDDPIRIVTAGTFLEEQTADGFSLKREIVDDTQFALSALSNDKDYDIFYFRTREAFAADMRDQGAFYPLNDVDGVREYLDACFPFIKDAATDENGDIWMLPIRVQVPYLTYNERVCNEKGLKFSDDMTAEEFVDAVIDYHSAGNTNYMIYGPYLYVELLLSDYVLTYQKFDTPEFRKLASLIKDKIYANSDAFVYDEKMTDIYEMGLRGKFTDQSFEMAFNPHSANSCDIFFWKENAKAVRIPMFTDSGKSVATGIFICVNPFSDNLENTLQYVSALSKTLLEQREIDCSMEKVLDLERTGSNSTIEGDRVMMMPSAEIYNRSEYMARIRDIYDTGIVRFTIPYEIYSDDFDSYINGETELENFIKEADRRLNIYLNE